jgi:hypothetical protein
MSVASEVGITFARELRRNVRSAKGIVSGLLFLLGGAGAVMIYTNVNQEIGRAGVTDITPAKRMALQAMYDDPNTVDHLVRAPALLGFLYGATLIFLPMLCILIGYDQLAGDLQYRTIRYATVRARRESLVIGKALAVWAAASIVALALHAFAWIFLIARGEANAGVTLTYGLQFWVAAVLFSAGYVGLTMLVSGAYKTPVLALLTTLLAAFAWWLMRAYFKTRVEWIAALAPGSWEPRALSPDVARWGVGAVALLAFGVAGVAGACAWLRSRDV